MKILRVHFDSIHVEKEEEELALIEVGAIKKFETLRRCKWG